MYNDKLQYIEKLKSNRSSLQADLATKQQYIDDFEKMYVMCDNEKIGMSCMICRQVIQEFFEKDKMIIAMNPNGDEIVHTVEELCPYPFDEEDLK